MNKKCFFRLVALVAAMMCALSASAYDFKYGNFYYDVVNDSIVEVTNNTGYNTYSGNVTIPEWVLYNGKSYTVGGIGSFAFYQCSSLISVTIPNSVTYISGHAFNGCGSLVRVTMGKNCDFYNEYTYGVGIKAFANCPNLTYITCWNKNPFYFLETDGYLNFEQKVFDNAILYVPRGSEATYQSLEGWRLFAHIQEIDTDYNFDFCVNGIYYKYRSGTSNAVKVTYRDEDYNSYSGSVTIPASVTYNGTSYNVTAIDNHAFRDCSNMTSVSLPASLDSIGSYAFINCTRLTEVEIPNTVAEMGNGVFQNCSALKSLQFPASLTVIYASMCRNCTALETLIIPSHVNNVYVNAFSNCTALKKVICFPAEVPSMNYQTTFPTEAYNNATLYTVDGAQGYTSPYGYWNNFTTKKPYSELLDAALNTTGGSIHFTSTGDYPWLVKGTGSSAYAQSGNKFLPSSASSLTAEVTLPAGGTLYFDFKAWGEGTNPYYDICKLFVNGEQHIISEAYQNSSWVTYSVELPAGTSTLEWRYSKDSSVNNPGDYFAIDNVRIAAPEAYACYTPSNTTLTFYYDNQRSNRSGTTYDLNGVPGWCSDETYPNVTKVVFNSSFANARPTSTSLWFSSMGKLESITGMEYLNTSEVTDLSWMFAYCEKLASLDVSHFNTAKVTDMGYMFRNCTLLTSLDVSSFNTSKVMNMSYMFEYCKDLRTICAGDGWSTAAVMNSNDMFNGCTSLVGGKGTTYDGNHVDAAYAHIDGGTSNPGYFTSVSLDDVLNVEGGNIHFETGGEYPWILAVDEDGTVCARSSNAGVPNSTSTLTATVTVTVPGTSVITVFKARGEGTSPIYDACTFAVDGNLKFSFGSNLGNYWNTNNSTLEVGTHTLTWTYSKDNSVNPDGDFFAIKSVELISPETLRGDVNGDGSVDISDVTDLIAAVLNGTPVDPAVADMNGDSLIDVTDVTDLISRVLNGA